MAKQTADGYQVTDSAVIKIIASFTDYDERWLAHIVEERLRNGRDETYDCGCKLGHERELVQKCPKWEAIEMFWEAEDALEKAQHARDLAAHNLDTFS